MGSIDNGGTRALMQSYACPPGSLLVVAGHAHISSPILPYLHISSALKTSVGCGRRGGLQVFTESLLHATAEWTHPTRGRVAIFTHYCR